MTSDIGADEGTGNADGVRGGRRERERDGAGDGAHAIAGAGPVAGVAGREQIPPGTGAK